MRTVCLWLAAAGFVASAALHLLSFTPWAALPGERAVWALGALAFVLAAGMGARLRGAITVRMASGHLIFFFLVPLVFFRWVEPGLSAPGTAAAPPRS